MKHLSRLLIVGIAVLAVLTLLVVPVAAQDEELPEGAGEGGVLLTPNIGDDPATFNPIISSDSASSDVHQWLYPEIIGISPTTGVEDAPLPGAMAESWEYDETGTVLTIHLREDLTWNDGTPITAADYLWSVEAVRSGETSSPRTNVFATLADGTPSTGKVETIEAPDDYTIVVTFTEPDCVAFTSINDITPVPAHIWEDLYGDNYALMDEEPRRIPEVTYGPFKDPEFAPGERVSLIDDQNYAVDAQLGYVSPSEWVYLSVPDLTVSVERFLAGDVTYMAIPADRQAEFRDNPDFQTYEYTPAGYNYMGYNLADPNNPQPGIDEEGNIVEQDLHPVFGDVRVRQALTHAVDVDAMIDGILDGNGVRISTHAIPTSWAQPFDLEHPAYDPDLALEMLAEAGWVDDDDDPSTPLVCQGCLYATEVDPEFEGSPFTFELITNSGNNIRERIGEFIESQLGDIGVDVDYQAIDFGVVVDRITAQTFDAVIIGWIGLSLDPGDDISGLFTVEADQPGSGFNFTSYNNPELSDLLQEVRTLPGCDQTERREIYDDIQTTLFEDQPYMFLFVANNMAASQANVENWDPLPFSRIWNIDAWRVIEE